MTAEVFRHFYEYHFAENRSLWNRHITSLSQEQFTQPVAYSHGSARDQIVHMMNVDNAWFSDLRGEIIAELTPFDTVDRAAIRAFGDSVERGMRDYLTNLPDEMLFDKPLKGEDENLTVWQVLLHVVNHGTDHRAQVLRLLNDLGVKTGPQDFIFYVYDNP